MATSEDARTLKRLADVDSAAPLTGQVMLAEVDGKCLAAMSLDTGSMTANPFKRTAAIVAHLHMQREQVIRRDEEPAPARSLLHRLVPVPMR